MIWSLVVYVLAAFGAMTALICTAAVAYAWHMDRRAKRLMQKYWGEK